MPCQTFFPENTWWEIIKFYSSSQIRKHVPGENMFRTVPKCFGVCLSSYSFSFVAVIVLAGEFLFIFPLVIPPFVVPAVLVRGIASGNLDRTRGVVIGRWSDTSLPVSLKIIQPLSLDAHLFIYLHWIIILWLFAHLFVLYLLIFWRWNLMSNFCKIFWQERRLEKKANTLAFKEEKKRQVQQNLNNRVNIQGLKLLWERRIERPLLACGRTSTCVRLFFVCFFFPSLLLSPPPEESDRFLAAHRDIFLRQYSWSVPASLNRLNWFQRTSL